MNTRLHAPVALAAALLCLGVGAAQGSAPADVVAESTSTPEPSAVANFNQEPGCLNIYLSGCGAGVESLHFVSAAVLAGAYRVRSDMTYEPVLVDRVDVEASPFALTYHLVPQARWSDGVPVTADDVIFTLQTIQNPANLIADRAGYSLVTQATKIDAKTVRLVFSQRYPAWKRLFPHVLPKHVLEGQDFNTALASSIPVSSGPFAFGDWQRGAQISLVRNASWWKPQLAHLNQIVVRFLPGVVGIQALTNGQITLTATEPLAQLVGLPPSIQLRWGRSTLHEKIDVNTASATMPLLGQPWFRKALAHAFDREKAVDLAYQSLSSVLVPCCLDALQSLVQVQQRGDHAPHFAASDYSPAKVAQLMQANGCVLGGDGIWSCGGNRASVKFATTTNNTLRETVQNSAIADANAAGIALVPDNSPPQVFFGTRLTARDFELAMYASPSTGDPTVDGIRAKYGCAGASNFMAYCSSAVDGLIGSAESELDDAARSTLWNQVSDALAQDVPSIPLFQRPTFVAHLTTLAGVEFNASSQGVGWNVEGWRFPATFTISNDAPANGVTGTPYSFVFKPVAGTAPHAFTLTGGALPPGLTLSPAGGLEGTPTTAGTFHFSVGASQCCGGAGAAASFAVRIRDPLAVTTTRLPSGTVGAPYSAPLTATGAGGATLGWSLASGSLPAGLAFTAAGISGTPTATGQATFTVKAGDIDGFSPDRSATKELTLRILAPLAASSRANARGIVGKTYRGASPQATGGLAPYGWKLAGGTVGPGLALDAATGRIAGKPSRAGTFRYTLGVSDAESRTASVGLSVTIVGVLDVVTSRLAAARAGRMYRAKLASRGGAAPKTWRLAKGKLPKGVKLAKTGVLNGKPRAAGTFRFQVVVSDALRQKSIQALKLTVRG